MFTLRVGEGLRLAASDAPATSELVVPRSIPAASRCWWGAADWPGSAICRAPSAGLVQVGLDRLGLGMQLVQKLHLLTDCAAVASRRRASSNNTASWAICAWIMPPISQQASRLPCGSADGAPRKCLAQFHLFHQECRIVQRIVLPVDLRAFQAQQILGAFERDL